MYELQVDNNLINVFKTLEDALGYARDNNVYYRGVDVFKYRKCVFLGKWYL